MDKSRYSEIKQNNGFFAISIIIRKMMPQITFLK